MTPKLEQVLAKVRKLRALAAGTASVAEAASAAAMADRLIQAHCLDEASIEAMPLSDHEEIGEDETPVWSMRDKPTWRHALLTVLGRHYGCSTWTKQLPDSWEGRIVGRPSDVAIVRYMLAWSTTEITRLSRMDATVMSRTDRAAFCRGAVDGFYVALSESKRKQLHETSDRGAAIVLHNRADLAEQARDVLHPDLGRMRNRRPVGRASYEAGVRAGARLENRNNTALPPVNGRLLGSGK